MTMSELREMARPMKPDTGLFVDRVWEGTGLTEAPRSQSIRIQRGRYDLIPESMRFYTAEARWLAYELARAFPDEARMGAEDAP